MEEGSITNSSKQGRRRKKHLHKLILSLMEFYFGDSNLSKDRFLTKLIQDDSYVDLSVFLTFNKIKQLTNKIEDIVSALQKSSILELSEDGLKVRRITPIQQRDDVDKCTIYVERIPVDFTHDTLIKIFSEFGNVEYVSIPKYKHNQMIKGFAFIEFDSPEAANKTLEHFASIGCRLPSQIPPDKLYSICTYEPPENKRGDGSEKKNTGEPVETVTKYVTENENAEDKTDVTEDNVVTKETDEQKESNVTESDVNENKQKCTDSRKRTHSSSDREVKDNVSETDSDKQNNKESNESRKRKLSVGNDEFEDKKGKAKSSDVSENKEETDNEKQTNKEVKKRKHSTESQATESKKVKFENSESESVNPEVQDEQIIKNKDINTEEPEEENMDETSADDETGKRKRKRKKNQKRTVFDIKELGLQVLSKCEWKRLRNKYLDLQRTRMKTLKQQLNRAKYCNAQYLQNSKSNNPVSTTTENKTQTDDTKKLAFAPGIIVHVQLPEPCIDVKMFKAELKSYSSDIQYIDVGEGKFEAYVRFSTNEAAEQFTQCHFAATMTVLTGDPEKDYWAKIGKDRQDKFQKGHVRQRGRDKLLKRAEKVVGKHIRFEDTD